MSFMRKARRRLLQERLNGLEFRNKQRAARRRLILAASLERQRLGQAREWGRWKRA